MVARLEKICRTAVEHANGREVIQYRGAILPLGEFQSASLPSRIMPLTDDELCSVEFRFNP
jgi:hypothetical protein